MPPLHINEYLCFLTVQFDKLDRENLISTLVEFYSYREALDAKNTLVSECEKASLNDSIKEFSLKRVEGKSRALRRVVTNAFDIWTVVDREKAGELSVNFVAANPNRLPSVNAEKFNLQFLITSIVKLQETVSNQDSSLNAISQRIDNLSSNSNINNNDNRNKNKRRLSGSAPSFTPKRHQAASTSAGFSTPAASTHGTTSSSSTPAPLLPVLDPFSTPISSNAAAPPPAHTSSTSATNSPSTAAALTATSANTAGASAESTATAPTAHVSLTAAALAANPTCPAPELASSGVSAPHSASGSTPSAAAVADTLPAAPIDPTSTDETKETKKKSPSFADHAKSLQKSNNS